MDADEIWRKREPGQGRVHKIGIMMRLKPHQAQRLRSMAAKQHRTVQNMLEYIVLDYLFPQLDEEDMAV